jgi:ribose 5-phosphate isomerase B
MRVGIATDPGGFNLIEEAVSQFRAAGHEVVDFGAHGYTPDGGYPDVVVALAHAVAAGEVVRGIDVCGCGAGASVCANKILGASAGLIRDQEFPCR